MTVSENFDYRLTPTDIAPFLRGEGNLLCLDSSLVSADRGRYSYVMAAPSVILTVAGDRVELSSPQGGRTIVPARNPLEVCELMLAGAGESSNASTLPPFRGGWGGYVGYEFGAALEGVAPGGGANPGEPDAVLCWYDWVLAWDHRARAAWIIVREQRRSLESLAREAEGSSVRPGRRTAVNSERVMQKLRMKLAQCARGEEPARPAGNGKGAAVIEPALVGERVPGWPSSVLSDFSREEYMRAVDRVRELILAGDIFQANISQRFQTRQRNDAWELYLRLREMNPVPYAAFLEHESGAVLSASPEMFLSLNAEGVVETRPIKGTRPRTGDSQLDDLLGMELLASEKDRSENLMIVDLLRNDLSRVCEPGSVYVPALFALERWATVQHLVSTVRGTLRSDASAIDLFRACFPGGSITGAPKIRAMQVIAEIERRSRGVYCGCMGYFAADGGALLNIAIRTVTVANGVVSFAAGGGIVADSDAASEYEESLAKAAGMLAAVTPYEVAAVQA